MWQPIIAYIKFLAIAKTKFSVHSPFVFEFITKALESNLPSGYTSKLNRYRKDLLESKKLIKVTDFGAGSRVFKSNHRKVKAIAKYAGINPTKANLLQKIVHFFLPNNILEIGTSLGIGTAAMHIANPNSKITSLEGCPETAKLAKEMFLKHKIENIELVIGEFSETLPILFKKNVFDLIHFDGNHQKEATINYFESCKQSIHNDSLLIFDDIHWSKDMEEAWQYIQKDLDVSLSIDLYHFGLISFRKEQTKQNFILQF